MRRVTKLNEKRTIINNLRLNTFAAIERGEIAAHDRQRAWMLVDLLCGIEKDLVRLDKMLLNARRE